MLVHDAQRGAGRDRRAAPVATSPPLQRLGAPGLGALQGGSPAALPGRLLELRAALAVQPRCRASWPASSRASTAETRQPAAARSSATCSSCRTPTSAPGPSPPSPAAHANDEAGQRGPAGTPLLTELAYRCAGFLKPRLACPSRMRPAPAAAAPQRADLPALLLELQHGLLGRLHGLAAGAPTAAARTCRRVARRQVPVRAQAVRQGRGSAARPALTAQCADPAEILVHEPQRRSSSASCTAAGLVQSASRRRTPAGSRTARPGSTDPLHPHMIGGAAQHGSAA